MKSNENHLHGNATGFHRKTGRELPGLLRKDSG